MNDREKRKKELTEEKPWRNRYPKFQLPNASSLGECRLSEQDLTLFQ